MSIHTLPHETVDFLRLEVAVFSDLPMTDVVRGEVREMLTRLPFYASGRRREQAINEELGLRGRG